MRGNACTHTGGGLLGSCRCADTPYRHNTEEFAAYRPTSRRGFTGRGRSELDSRAGIRTRGYPSEYAGFGNYFHGRPIPIRDQCQLEFGWARHARVMEVMSLAISLDFSRSNARGRSDLHSLEAWTSQTHDSPGILQGRRSANAASSAFRLLGVSQTCPEGERRCWPPAAAEGINAHATGMRWWTKPPVGYRSGPPRPAGADPIQSIPHCTGERNVLSWR